MTGRGIPCISFGDGTSNLAATQAGSSRLGSGHIPVPQQGRQCLGPQRCWAFTQPSRPLLCPDLSTGEARAPSWLYNALFSRSDRRSRRSRSLLFWRVRGWREAPERGTWAEAGRDLPPEKKGEGKGEGTPISKEAAHCLPSSASNQPPSKTRTDL